MKMKGVVSPTLSSLPADIQNPHFPLTRIIGGDVLFMFRAQLRPASPVVEAQLHVLVPTDLPPPPPACSDPELVTLCLLLEPPSVCSPPGSSLPDSGSILPAFLF